MSYLDHRVTILGESHFIRHAIWCTEPCGVEQALKDSPLRATLSDGLYVASATDLGHLHIQEVHTHTAESVG